MKKVLVSVLAVLTIILVLGGCATKESKEFKSEYEALNGKTNASGKVHRTISIPKNNPFEKVSAKDIVSKIENKETFYVYFGDELCPWCRSVIEKAIEVAKKNKVKKIYYVKIWDENGTEILRDKYQLTEEGDLEEIIEGTEEYKKFLEYFDALLEEYTLSDGNGNEIDVTEKRIFAPNFIYVENGVAKRIATGISEDQDDSRAELTPEILKEEERLFNEFFR